jgi:hypothetical protein
MEKTWLRLRDLETRAQSAVLKRSGVRGHILKSYECDIKAALTARTKPLTPQYIVAWGDRTNMTFLKIRTFQTVLWITLIF